MLREVVGFGCRIGLRYIAGAAACVGLLVPLSAPSVPAAAQAAPVPPPLPACRLAYSLQPGTKRRYRIAAIFHGHIPPFSQAGSEPITLRVILEYSAYVGRSDAAGAQVQFTVEDATVSLLDLKQWSAASLDPAAKVDPDAVADIPLPLAQVQDALDATAILRPDGSVASIQGGKAGAVKINLGFEVRKLFLLIMPVAFPDRAVAVGDTWSFADGVLGSNPGTISYSAHVESAQSGAGGAVTYRLGEEDVAVIHSRMDTEYNPTTNAAAAIGTLSGRVTATGELSFITPAGQTDPQLRAGHVQTGRWMLTANIHRKRDKLDPHQPELPLEDNIDVRARLDVDNDTGAAKTVARSAQ